MTKTLFWYIFWNLLKVFVMSTAALAGMMSFGGILRPLTENGLDFGQVNRLLLYFLPAMATYSLPVAALFATTMVYGRFSADNELNAMRACGISYVSPRKFSVALPALVLGLVVSVTSLVMLCFIVPIFSLKIEMVIKSNITHIIQSNIARKHEMDFPSADKNFEIYADSAKVLDRDPTAPWLQRVELTGPAIITQFDQPDVADSKLLVPREFSMASTAIISVDPAGGSTPARITASLTNGIKFPRQFFGNQQVGVASSGFGPIYMPSLTENVKFLNVDQLAAMADDPGRAQRVQVVLHSLIRRRQGQIYLQEIYSALQHRAADGTSSFAPTIESPDSDTFQIGQQNATIYWPPGGDNMTVTAPGGPDARGLWLMEMHGSQQTLFANAKMMNIRVQAILGTPTDPDGSRLAVTLDLYDVRQPSPDGPIDRASFTRNFSVPMSAEILAVQNRSLRDFNNDPVALPGTAPADPGFWQLSGAEAFLLHHEQVEAKNAARSELHCRASFAVSCLCLVMVGCALGVTLKSGNVLNAFAASFVPALFCITLIICGQQVATHVPWTPDKVFRDPLQSGLCFIWIGNLLVLVAAILLTFRLQKR